MIPSNIESLIKALIEKTNDKKAIWGKTARENEFKLIFDKGAVTTDSWNTEGQDAVDFGIYNSFGDRIDSFYALKPSYEYDLLIQIHDAAKREFFKVDETITSLIKEVESLKSVGKREIEGEDLPF